MRLENEPEESNGPDEPDVDDARSEKSCMKTEEEDEDENKVNIVFNFWFLEAKASLDL